MKIIKGLIAAVLLFLGVGCLVSGGTSAGIVLLVIVFAAFVAPKARAREAAEKKQIGDRKERAAENGLACCPKCGSTSLSANKKGFGAGKAVAGALLTTNPLGLAAGGIGSRKITVTCLNCGYTFKPGKAK